MSKKNKSPSNTIRNQIIKTFAVSFLLIFSYGVTVFYLSAQTRQILEAANGISAGVNPSVAATIDHNVRLLAHISFLFLSLGIVLFIYLMFNLMFTITPALRRIMLATQIIKDGNFNYRLNLNVNSELGDIATTLNQALDKVHAGARALELEKAGVERQVARRTKELRVERGKFLASINGLPLGFMLVDDKGRILMLNPAMENLLNIHELDVTEIAKKVTAEESILKKLLSSSQKVLRHKKAAALELNTEEGRYLHSLLSPISMSADAFNGVVILIEDVTEAKIIERSKDEFFSIASHELRTPLTAIRGNTSLILQYYKDHMKDGDLNEMIHDIHSSSMRLIDIVNDFLDVSKLEQDKIQFKLQAISIEETIDAVVNEISAVAAERQLYVKTDRHVLKQLPLVYADPERAEQILYNLIGNALKFVTEGGVSINGQVEGNYVKISVADTGRGISAENQQLLFRKFQQANASLLTRDTTRGTGLGLYISKLLTEQMGGAIKLERSEVNKGSTFSFSLPLASAKQISNVDN